MKKSFLNNKEKQLNISNESDFFKPEQYASQGTLLPCYEKCMTLLNKRYPLTCAQFCRNMVSWINPLWLRKTNSYRIRESVCTIQDQNTFFQAPVPLTITCKKTFKVGHQLKFLRNIGDLAPRVCKALHYGELKINEMLICDIQIKLKKSNSVTFFFFFTKVLFIRFSY